MKVREVIKRALKVNSCQQPLATVLPLINHLLSSKKFIDELAATGFRIDTHALQSLQIECIQKANDLSIEYRKIGETMQTNGEVLDAKQFLAVIKQAFKESKKPSITQWAKSLGVSYQFLSHVMNGDYNPGPAMAKALGYEQIYGFRRKRVPFTNDDIRKGVAALAGMDVKPADKGVVKAIKRDMAASKKLITKARKQQRDAARIYKGRKHGGKKAQAKKK